MTLEELQQLKITVQNELEQAQGDDELEALRIKYVGRKGLLPEVMKSLGSLEPAERGPAGRTANEIKKSIVEAVATRKQAAQAPASGEPFDATLPGDWRGWGTAHPISEITDRITDIFNSIGFTVAGGPDLETVFNNFDALNTPDDHPSRDPQDTFYLDDGRLLRCHTSPVQVRFMQTHEPPVRIIAPGRCYRRDTPDATHSANFHQVEGLYVNRKVSLADLKGDLSYFARRLMGSDVNIRFRPHFFPFTEPSVEVDFTCHVCKGSGCRVCKQSGWIEILGAGMVDPKVFDQVGYDPEEYTGYAFGMGIERIAMILFGISDIRHLYDNDARFLAQF